MSTDFRITTIPFLITILIFNYFWLYQQAKKSQILAPNFSCPKVVTAITFELFNALIMHRLDCFIPHSFLNMVLMIKLPNQEKTIFVVSWCCGSTMDCCFSSPGSHIDILENHTGVASWRWSLLEIQLSAAVGQPSHIKNNRYDNIRYKWDTISFIKQLDKFGV